tara:strand:+ start:268 stop:789 length:522 start_codon:yes stop_codon:yes gene_type:complete
MKARHILLLLVCFQALFSQAQIRGETNLEETIFYFIRHAEKDRSSPNDRNPGLTQKGKLRALNWADFFRETPLKAIYSTNYIRTTSTAQPIAKEKSLPIIIYNPSKIKIQDFIRQNQGKQVLVVGHSNTTPQFANAILGDKKFEQMQDDDNSSLFILTESYGKITAERISVNH